MHRWIGYLAGGMTFLAVLILGCQKETYVERVEKERTERTTRESPSVVIEQPSRPVVVAPSSPEVVVVPQHPNVVVVPGGGCRQGCPPRPRPGVSVGIGVSGKNGSVGIGISR